MVFIIQQILPQYRHDLLRHLPEDKFMVFYSDDVKDHSLGSVATANTVFHKVAIKKIKSFYFQPIIPFIKKYRPKAIVVLPELKNLNYWWMFILKFIYKYELIAWTHGINNKDFYTRLSTQSKIRLLMMRLADKVLVYSHERAESLKKLIKKEVLVASNTLDTDQLNAVYHKLSTIPVSTVKDKYQVRTGKVLIYVGRLIKSKEVNRSIHIFKEVLQQVPDTTLLIVGDGPEKAALETYVSTQGLTGKVRFMGKISDSAIVGELLYLSDLQLHLGYVGLAVVDSMCFRTPVVTMAPGEQGPYHSPEFGYLKHDHNAIIGSVDQATLQVTQYLQDSRRLNALQDNARQTFLQECSMKNFLHVLNNLDER